MTVLQADRHAVIGSYRERPLKVAKVDLGDLDVDEDVLFGNDALIFTIHPSPNAPDPGFILKTVTYAIGTYDGQDNVLLRQTRIERAGLEPLVGLAPLAFDVLGFDVLYWNPNAAPADQGWVKTWDSSQQPNFAPPKLPLPASVYARLTIRADRRPAEQTASGAPVEVSILESVVNIEQTISNNVLYPRPKL
jgi:hypothetical protein